MWTLADNFLDLVGLKWNFQGHGTAQFKLKQLLLGLKRPLKHLNYKHFSHISSRAAVSRKRLLDAQNSVLSPGQMLDGISELRHEANRLSEAEKFISGSKNKM